MTFYTQLYNVKLFKGSEIKLLAVEILRTMSGKMRNKSHRWVNQGNNHCMQKQEVVGWLTRHFSAQMQFFTPWIAER